MVAYRKPNQNMQRQKDRGAHEGIEQWTAGKKSVIRPPDRISVAITGKKQRNHEPQRSDDKEKKL